MLLLLTKNALHNIILKVSNSFGDFSQALGVTGTPQEPQSYINFAIFSLFKLSSYKSFAPKVCISYVSVFLGIFGINSIGNCSNIYPDFCNIFVTAYELTELRLLLNMPCSTTNSKNK